MELLVLFSLIFLGAPIAITLAVPARVFGFCVAWLATLVMTFNRLPSGRDHSSPFSGIDGPLHSRGALAAACVRKSILIAARGHRSGWEACRRRAQNAS